MIKYFLSILLVLALSVSAFAEMRSIKKATADQSVVIRIIDSSDGSPETAVEHDTSGIDLWYRKEGATKTSITEAALASLDAAHSDGGIEHIGDGYYRLDLPDAAFTTANGVMIGGTVTGMIVIGVYVPLVDYDPYDATRMGLATLPNAAANAAGGLPISTAGGLDLDTKLANTHEITAARMGALTDWINGGRLDLILDIIANDTTTDIPAILGTPANLGGGATIAQNLSDIEGQTDDIGTAGAGLTNIDLPDQTMNITGNLSGSVGSVSGAVGSISGVTFPTNFSSFSITAAGRVDVAAVAGTAQTAGDIYGALGSGTYGLSAIENLVDDLESRLTATRAGYLDYLNTINSKLPTNYIMGSTVQTAKDDEIDDIRTKTYRLPY